MARDIRPFDDAQDLAARAQIHRRDLEALAAANALASPTGNRRPQKARILRQTIEARD